MIFYPPASCRVFAEGEHSEGGVPVSGSRPTVGILMPGKRYCGHVYEQAVLRGAGDENRTCTISLGMSAADGPGQPSRRSACTLVAPSMTVNPRNRPTHRARDGHGGPFAPKPSRLRFGEMRSGR